MDLDVKTFKIPDRNFKWVGAVLAGDGHIYGIPNKMNQVLEIIPDEDRFILWGEDQIPNDDLKKWTGGCWWKGYVYGFPRGANTFLEIDIVNKQCKTYPLGTEYDFDHHYGGVLTPKGIVYQPPRYNNTIMSIDLNKRIAHEIPLPERAFGKKYLYYGGVYSCGLVFFFPRGRWERVMVLDPKTEQVTYCKGHVHNFGASAGCVARNGYIYAFASYGNGILEINPQEKRSRVIHKKDVMGGFYGTVEGVDNYLYSVCGDADCIYRYNCISGECETVYNVAQDQKGQKAKCAGGTLDSEGNIWFIPAVGEYLYKIMIHGAKSPGLDYLLEHQYDRGCY